MRVIVIDAFKLEVREEEISDDQSHLKDFYRLLDCGTVDVIRVTDVHDLWIDDEGNFRDDENPRRVTLFNTADGGTLRISGSAILAEHRGSKTVATTVKLEDVKAHVKFLVTPA